MPKKAREMTMKAVAAIREDGRHAVGGVPGLSLRVAGNARSWILRITDQGRRRDLGLGSFPEIGLAEAREKALDYRRALRMTLAPRWPFGAAAQATPHASSTGGPAVSAIQSIPPRTFEQCAREYINAQAPGWKSLKHVAQWSATLERYAFPVIGRLQVAKIDDTQILAVLRPIWQTKTETATRVRGRMEAIFDWAIHKGFRVDANPARWEHKLEHDLPSPTKLKKRNGRHHAALPYTRLGAFMADLHLHDGISARALEWGILTAARFQEIAGAKRREVNLQLKRWTVPAERMKREIEHVVPLSDEAIALFTNLPPGNDDDLIFPAPRGGRLSDAALGAMIDGMHDANVRKGDSGYMDPKEGRIATQHGFRSTFRDWASEVRFFDREIVEHAIAHKLKDKAEAAYQRGELLMKRALIMREWGVFCRTPEFVAPDLAAHMKSAA